MYILPDGFLESLQLFKNPLREERLIANLICIKHGVMAIFDVSSFTYRDTGAWSIPNSDHDSLFAG